MSNRGGLCSMRHSRRCFTFNVIPMACDSINTIHFLINSDRRYLAKCRWIYGIILLVSVGLALFLQFFVLKNNSLTSLSALLANGIAFPLVPKHLQRSSALAILEGLSRECARHEEHDPQCKRIADNVDSLLRARGSL
jgi:hypothetical protein